MADRGPSLISIDLLLPLAGVAGAVLALTRGRFLFYLVAAALAAAILVIVYTPLTGYLVRGLVRRDAVRPADAVVVLSAAMRRNGEPGSVAELRLLHGYELLGQRYAPRLVITRTMSPYGSALPAVREQLQRLRLDVPVDEVGPTGNTHDEGVAVARLCRERGWRAVILVTDPWHMRRAAATFRKSGVPILCSPCVERAYDFPYPLGRSRLHAFRDWLMETISFRIYQLRGWV